jgi:hypothetical protein
MRFAKDDADDLKKIVTVRAPLRRPARPRRAARVRRKSASRAALFTECPRSRAARAPQT